MKGQYMGSFALCWLDHTQIYDEEHGRNDAKKSTYYASNVDHVIFARNHLLATNPEKGWVIDSGVSVHMISFRKDCRNNQPANRKIFLVDGSTALCKEVGTIDIPIINGQIMLRFSNWKMY